MHILTKTIKQVGKKIPSDNLKILDLSMYVYHLKTGKALKPKFYFYIGVCHC